MVLFLESIGKHGDDTDLAYLASCIPLVKILKPGNIKSLLNDTLITHRLDKPVAIVEVETSEHSLARLRRT